MNSDDEKVIKDLGGKLRAAREKAGLTQLDVAKSVEINKNYYAMVERGEKNISYKNLQKILKLLNIKSLDIS